MHERQGSSLRPYIFNMHAEEITRQQKNGKILGEHLKKKV